MRAVIESELRNRDLDNSTDGSNEGRSLLVSLTIPVIFPPYMKFEIRETAPVLASQTLWDARIQYLVEDDSRSLF